MVKHRPLLSFWVIRPCSLASDCKPIVELITGDIVPAYNEKKRAGGTLPTTINYTGQRLDGSGLVYMNARYYDPLVGMFISPDTIVPDAGVLIDYNRFAYGRANPLKFSDPSGHCAEIEGNANGLCLRTTRGKITGVVRGGSVFRNYVEVALANLNYGNSSSINALPESGGALDGTIGYSLVDVEAALNGDATALTQLVALAALSQMGGVASGANAFRPTTSYPTFSTAQQRQVYGSPDAPGTWPKTSTQQVLQGLANTVENTLGGRGAVAGTRKHSLFENLVNALGRNNLHTEVSYLNGRVVPRGTQGSVRLDVVEGSALNPTSVYDLKTGKAGLTPSRISQIQSHIPGGSNVPVIGIYPQ